MKKVSIIIPNWNGENLLKKNLPEILKIKDIDEIIIVDDASTDGSTKLIKRDFPEIKLIEKRKNTGFGSNVNLGVKQAIGDYIFLVNSDAVPEPNCLKYILPHFEDQEVFSVGCNTGGNWSWAKFERGYLWHYMVPKKKDLKTHETLWASGGSGVFRKSIWDKLGGFDPLYDPFYVEDLDLGYRAWKRGYKNIWEVKAIVEHYKEPGVIDKNFSKRKITDTSERNMLIFVWKNIHENGWINAHIRALCLRLVRHPKYWLPFLRALVKLPQILEQRREELGFSVISDKKLLAKFHPMD